MKRTFYKFLKPLLVCLVTMGMLTACNKDVEDAEPNPKPTSSTTATIADLLASDASYSLLRRAATRVPGLLLMLGDRDAIFTVFAPDDAAFARSGISAAVIDGMPLEQLTAVLRYHIVGGQRISSANIPTTFPNIQLPTQLVLAPPSASLPPGLRMSIFPSKRGTTAWANNIPIISADAQTANGVVHKVAALVAPPSVFLWNRIDTDPNLTYLKAAIQRADEGVPAASGLQATLLNPAASLTVFAPNNTAFQQLLTLQITAALMAQGVPQATALAQATVLASTPAVFTNPALATVLTPTTVRGLVAYHLLTVRAFSVNLPTTATDVNTALTAQIPGTTVKLQATFGPAGVTAATVKGLANTTASNVQINPAANGTSDQHYVNGVLHVIDQVLRPQ